MHKAAFYDCKRMYKQDPSIANKMSFLQARSTYCQTKRIAKNKFYSKESKTLSILRNSNPKKFWKYINKYKINKKTGTHDVTLDDLIDHFNIYLTHRMPAYSMLMKTHPELKHSILRN